MNKQNTFLLYNNIRDTGCSQNCSQKDEYLKKLKKKSLLNIKYLFIFWFITSNISRNSNNILIGTFKTLEQLQ